ncbi:MAG: hypothetical protein ACI87J_001545 [Colwellia sp.]|jgi:hypothetical protein
MRHTSKYLNNKAMNSNTYALRKKVMNIVYQANELVPGLPRINVRITDDSDTIMGVGNSKTCTIWLTESTINSKRLKEIIFHEIVHAAFGLGHFEGCKLMDAKSSLNPTNAELDDLLFQYSKRQKH